MKYIIGRAPEVTARSRLDDKQPGLKPASARAFWVVLQQREEWAMATSTRFAGYPSAQVYQNSDGTKPIQHLLWGVWLRLKRGRNGDFVEVHARGLDGWMHKDDIQKERLLEIVFVDIGQGDGCLLVTPDDKHMVIDAGEGDNMRRFLNWRYGGFDDPWTFEAGVISHPDMDHYGGFEELFDIENVRFKTIYHNGIMERKGANALGAKKKSGRRSYLTQLIHKKRDLEDFLSVKARWTRKKFPTMIAGALENRKFDEYRMLAVSEDQTLNAQHLPGYGPDKDLSIRILGPVTEAVQNEQRLRWLSSVGKTKNGHSVVLRLQYRDVSVLLGGDLNIPSENLLLSHHTGLDAPADNAEDEEVLIEAARKVFRVDIAKSCHHGSSDFSSTFLAATDPIVTVISSGDNEPHSHPRADTLGTIGKFGRGARPLIFSTELARSAKETIKHPNVLRAALNRLVKQIDQAEDDSPQQKRLEKKRDKLLQKLTRSVAVYGAINVRSDGRKVVMAQKLEQSRRSGNRLTKWDIYRLEPQGTGSLRYISKHGGH
jgi:beta-lactamase superfamily II metal-dependent hydrolase